MSRHLVLGRINETHSLSVAYRIIRPLNYIGQLVQKATFDGLLHIIEFEPHERRLVEWNLHNAENIYFSGIKKIYCLHHEF